MTRRLLLPHGKARGEYRQGTIISVYYGVGMFEHLSLVVPHDFEFNGEKAVITKNGKVLLTSENSKMLKALYEICSQRPISHWKNF